MASRARRSRAWRPRLAAHPHPSHPTIQNPTYRKTENSPETARHAPHSCHRRARRASARQSTPPARAFPVSTPRSGIPTQRKLRLFRDCQPRPPLVSPRSRRSRAWRPTPPRRPFPSHFAIQNPTHRKLRPARDTPPKSEYPSPRARHTPARQPTPPAHARPSHLTIQNPAQRKLRTQPRHPAPAPTQRWRPARPGYDFPLSDLLTEDAV